MSDGEALLKAILSSPAEDTPRLVYADWLEENGQPERAELIRVQVELAVVRHRVDRAGEYSRLLDREVELMEKAGGRFVPAVLRGLYCTVVWHRGFVDEVSLTWDSWCENAAAILRESPIRKVVLMTWPEVGWRSIDRFAEWQGIWLVNGNGQPIGEEREFGMDESPYAILLGERWPGIEFELPREVGVE